MWNLIFTVVILLAAVPVAASDEQAVYQISEKGKQNAEYLTDSAMFLYHLKKDQEKKAVSFILKILDQKPDSHFFSILAAESLRQGTLSKEKYLELVDRHPESAVLNSFAAVMLLEKEEKEQANAILKRAISYRLDPPAEGVPPRGISESENPEHIQKLFLFQLAILQDAEKYEEANRFLQKIEEVCRMELSDSYLLELIKYHLRAIPKTKNEYNQTSFQKYHDMLTKRLEEPNTFHTGIDQQILELLWDNGESDLAEAACAEALLTDPANILSYQNMKRLFLIKNSPWNALRCSSLEDTFYRLQRKRPSQQFFTERMKLILLTEDPFRIRKEADFLVSINGINDHLLSAVAEFFLNRNDLKAAVHFQQKIKNPAIRELLTPFILQRQKKYKEALMIFLKLERAFPEIELYKYMAAEAAEDAGEKEIHQQFINEMLLKAEDHHGFQNYLSYTWAEKGINLDQAETLIRKALKKEPENYAYLDTLAWVLYRKKQYKEAKTEIMKAIALCNTKMSAGVLMDHAGDIFHALGEEETAKTFWQKAAQSKDPELDLKEVMKKLPKPVIHEEAQQAQTPESKADDPKTAPTEP